MTAITLELHSIVDLTDEQFYQLCQANPDIRLERTPEGELVVMPPAGGGSSKRNADLTTDLNIWNRRTRLGVVFDSSGGFSLPNVKPEFNCKQVLQLALVGTGTFLFLTPSVNAVELTKSRAGVDALSAQTGAIQS